MRRVVIGSGVAVAALAVLLLAATNAFTSAPPIVAAQPWGSWYWLTDLSAVVFPGANLPTVISFHPDGTFMCSEGNTFGGYEGATELNSTNNGTWVRMGANSFRATRLGFVFDKGTGVLTGISRSRFSFHFVGNKSDQIEGTLFVETLSCNGNPFGCPDPLDPNAVWTPDSPPQGYPGKAMRIHAMPVGPLS